MEIVRVPPTSIRSRARSKKSLKSAIAFGVGCFVADQNRLPNGATSLIACIARDEVLKDRVVGAIRCGERSVPCM